MKKEIQTQGIILKIYPLGEVSQKIILLSEIGLLNFIAHGTQKSLKKGKLFTLLYAHFHLNKKKGAWSLLEFNNSVLFENLSTDMSKFYTASVLSEVALHSYGETELFPLFLDTLKTLNKIEPKLSFYLLLQFWWQWIVLNGEQANLESCSSCEGKLRETYFFAHVEEGFLCSTCAQAYPSLSLYPFHQGIKRYLEISLQENLERSLQSRLDPSSLKNLGNYLCQKVQNILKWELKSWASGKNIIIPSLLGI